MPIGSIVIYRDKTTEFTYVKTVIHHIFLRIVRAIHHTRLRTPSFLFMMTGNNIDNPSHRVRTIQQRTGTTNHFHALYIRSHIGIRQRMSEHSSPLRLPVEQH